MSTPEMRCPSDSDLHDLLDGGLSANAKAALTTHVATCPQCAGRLEALQQLWATLGTACAPTGSDAPRAGVVDRIMQRLPAMPGPATAGSRPPSGSTASPPASTGVTSIHPVIVGIVVTVALALGAALIARLPSPPPLHPPASTATGTGINTTYDNASGSRPVATQPRLLPAHPHPQQPPSSAPGSVTGSGAPDDSDHGATGLSQNY